MSPLLQLRISVDYPSKPGVLRGLSLDIGAGEMLGLVGESGSGKSTVALSVLGLIEHKGGSATGQAWFRGRDLLKLRSQEMRQVRGREIALVLQSPLASLNPALKIGTQMAEAWRAHAGRIHSSGSSQWKERALEAFALVSLPDGQAFLDRYPRQVSVGQAQRILIAMSILHRPALLIADEPTSALDAITQSEILRLFQRLNRSLNMAVLFISHDLLSVASLCTRVAILQAGAIVESGSTEEMFSNPKHPYTRSLINALPARPFPAADGLEALARQLSSDRGSNVPEPAVAVYSTSVSEASFSTLIE